MTFQQHLAEIRARNKEIPWAAYTAAKSVEMQERIIHEAVRILERERKRYSKRAAEAKLEELLSVPSGK
jgi:hypothetical protein